MLRKNQILAAYLRRRIAYAEQKANHFLNLYGYASFAFADDLLYLKRILDILEEAELTQN